MKNLIQLFALLILITLSSCTDDNETLFAPNEFENNIERSFKTVSIQYDSNIDFKELDALKLELNVQKTIIVNRNSIVWIMLNNDKIEHIEEYVLFIDGVLNVDYVKGEFDDINQRDGDTNDGDTTGSGDTDSDQE